MSVLALGLDMVAVARVERMLARKGERALRRLLTDTEREYCLRQPVPARHIAARIAAKEAAYKAFQGTEQTRGIAWRELEVTRDSGGRPAMNLHGAALTAARRLAVSRVLLSITHTDSHAAAVVILTGENSD